MFYLTHLGNLMSYQFSYLDHIEKGQLERTKPASVSNTEWKQNLQRENENTKNFRACDVMTKSPITTSANELVTKVEKKFSKNLFRHIPVLKNDVVVGLISDVDLIKYKGDGGYNYLMSSDIMSILVICAHPNTPIYKISQVLIREKINAIPIVNEDGSLQGIITTSDILKLTVENKFMK